MEVLPATNSSSETDWFSAVAQDPLIPFPSDSEVDEILRSLVPKDELFEPTHEQWTPTTPVGSTWIPPANVLSFPPSIAPQAIRLGPSSPGKYTHFINKFLKVTCPY